MGLKYQNLLNLYNRRQKGRDYKVLYHGNIHMKLADNGDLTLHSTVSEKNPLTGKYEQRAKTNPDYIVRADNTLHVMKKHGPTEQTYRNVLRKYFDLYVHISSQKWTNRIRIDHGGKSYPFAEGTVIDLRNNSVVSAPEDTKVVTNRKASKPVYDYANKVINTMVVLERVGAFDTDKGGYNYYGGYRALEKADAEVLALCDDRIAELAELAYRQAKTRTIMPSRVRWVYVAGVQHRIEVPQHERDAVFKERLKANAKRYLHEVLKKHNGGFEVVEASNDSSNKAAA